MEERQSMIIDGNKLEIIASKINEHEWELSVENDYGIRSVWLEFFKSAEAALEVARRAIETEGIESFIDTNDFGYLLEE